MVETLTFDFKDLRIKERIKEELSKCEKDTRKIHLTDIIEDSLFDKCEKKVKLPSRNTANYSSGDGFRDFFNSWKFAKDNRNGEMPTTRDFMDMPLNGKITPYLMTLRGPDLDGEFVYVLFQRRLVEALNYDMTGKSTLQHPLRIENASNRVVYSSVVEFEMPLFMISSSRESQNIREWKRLILPYREPDSSIILGVLAYPTEAEQNWQTRPSI